MKNKKVRKVSLLLVPILFLGLFFFGGIALCQDPVQPEADFGLPGGEEGPEGDKFPNDAEVVNDGVEPEEEDIPIPTLENSTEQQNEGKDKDGTDETIEQVLQNLTQQKKEVSEKKQVVQMQNVRETQKKIVMIRLITLTVILLVAVLIVAIFIIKRKKNK